MKYPAIIVTADRSGGKGGCSPFQKDMEGLSPPKKIPFN